jgi:predicted membrane-bound spermidine synthase
MKNSRLYLLALVEGAAVISIEFLGGKLLIPHYGSSFTVWTSTIGVTMLSLMAGYFVGGYISKLKFKNTILFYLLLLVSFWMMLMPSLTELLIDSHSSEDIYLGSIYKSFQLLAFPLVLLGTIPPIIIQLLSDNKENAGSLSGKVFSLSTLGSIFFVLILGFFVIEHFGISTPLRIIGISILTVNCLTNLLRLQNKVLVSFLAAIVFLFGIKQLLLVNESKYFYSSEGLQGQLRIFDENIVDDNVVRHLQINGISQTKSNIVQVLRGSGPPFSRFLYPHVISSIAGSKAVGSEVLLLGFGGGSLGRELTTLGFIIDVVEIDKRHPALAEKYFFYDFTNNNVFIDDARHYIKQNKKKYDIIILDVAHGEIQPNHLLTKEGFTEMKNSLKPKGLLIVNYQSKKSDQKKPYLSVLKTLKSVELDVVVGVGEEDVTDFIFVTSIERLNITSLTSYNRLNNCCIGTKNARPYLFNNLKSFDDFDTTGYYNGLILDDDHPCLDIVNKEAAKNWRESALLYVPK